MNYDNFIFRKEWRAATDDLNDMEFRKVMNSVMDFVFDDLKPDKMSRLESIVYRLCVDSIAKDKVRYEEVCERRREAILKKYPKKDTKSKPKTSK